MVIPQTTSWQAIIWNLMRLENWYPHIFKVVEREDISNAFCRIGTHLRDKGVYAHELILFFRPPFWAVGLSTPLKRGSEKSIALDQTGYGAIQRVHLGPLNRTFPAPYFPGSPLSVENHCFGTLGQSASFRRRYPVKKSAKPEPATGMAGGDAQGALGTAGAMG